MKTENIKNEINNIIKHKLGLTSINTNSVFDILMKYYKKNCNKCSKKYYGLYYRYSPCKYEWI